MAKSTQKRYIVLLDSYEGDAMSLRCGDGAQNHMYCVASVGREGAALVDHGYRTISEARKAWPDAVPPPVDDRPIRRPDSR
jgi:hypothetical protein